MPHRLIRTIQELAKLDTAQKRSPLLIQMQNALQTPYIPMSDLELDRNIQFLDRMIARESFGDLLAPNQKPNNLIFIHRKHFPNRTINIIFEVATNSFELYFLTNRKYFNYNVGATKKCNSAEDVITLGPGASKVGKKCISVRFYEDRFIVTAKARLSVTIGKMPIQNIPVRENSTLEQTLKYYNDQLLHAVSQVKIYNIIMELYSNNVSKKFISQMVEEYISEKVARIDGIKTLYTGKPFIKQKDNDCLLITHVFDNLAQYNDLQILRGDIKAEIGMDVLKLNNSLNGVSIVFENIVNQAISAVDKMHKAGVINNDIKPPNILLIDKWTIRFTDYGAALDVRYVKKNTKRLLGDLGYLSTGNGYIDGHLLNMTDLSNAMFHIKILSKGREFSFVKPENNMLIPDLRSLNDHLQKNFNIWVDKFHLVATFTCASPEVYWHSKDIYFNIDAKNHTSLGCNVVVRRLSDASLKELYDEQSYKHDIWALGVSFLIMLDSTILSGYFENALSLVMYNPMLKIMLHPDMDQRGNIDDVIRARSECPIIKIPPVEQRVSLYKEYISLVYELNEKLNTISELRAKILQLCSKIKSNKELLKDSNNTNLLIDDVSKNVCVVSEFNIEMVKKTELLWPLLFAMIDLSRDQALCNLHEAIDVLISFMKNHMSAQHLEIALHISLLGNVSDYSLEMLCERLENQEGWNNDLLYYNGTSIIEKYLTEDIQDNTFRLDRLSWYIQRFNISTKNEPEYKKYLLWMRDRVVPDSSINRPSKLLRLANQ